MHFLLQRLRKERGDIERERSELERLKNEILELKSSSFSVKPSGDSRPLNKYASPPPLPTSSVGRKNRTATLLSQMNGSNYLGDNKPLLNSVDMSSKPSCAARRRTSVSAPLLKTQHTRRDDFKRSNKSSYALNVKGPSLAKAYFPDRGACTCCMGYIYGCDDKVCRSLGKCVCSLEDGEGTGQVKERKGHYEGIIKLNTDHKKDNQNFLAKVLRAYTEYGPDKMYLHVRRAIFGSFSDPLLASASEKEYMSVRFGVDLEESTSAFGLLAWR